MGHASKFSRCQRIICFHSGDHGLGAEFRSPARRPVDAERPPAPGPGGERQQIREVVVVIDVQVRQEDVVHQLDRHLHRANVAHAARPEVEEEAPAFSHAKARHRPAAPNGPASPVGARASLVVGEVCHASPDSLSLSPSPPNPGRQPRTPERPRWPRGSTSTPRSAHRPVWVSMWTPALLTTGHTLSEFVLILAMDAAGLVLAARQVRSAAEARARRGVIDACTGEARIRKHMVPRGYVRRFPLRRGCRPPVNRLQRRPAFPVHDGCVHAPRCRAASSAPTRSSCPSAAWRIPSGGRPGGPRRGPTLVRAQPPRDS